MPFSQNSFSQLVKQSSVVVMYLLFLFVQVFFNFDTGKHQFDAKTAKHAVVEKDAAQKHFNTDPGHSLTTKSRLNKRFQPSAAPVIAPLLVEPVVVYNTILTIGAGTDATYISAVATVHSLRGPPVDAPSA